MVILVAALTALPVLPAPLSTPTSARSHLTPAPRLIQESWDDIRAKISVQEMNPRPAIEVALAAKIEGEVLTGLPNLRFVRLDTLVDVLSDASGIRMRITDEAIAQSEDADFRFSAHWTQPVPLSTCLGLVSRDLGHSVTWHIEGEELVFSTQEERLKDSMFHLHPVKDLQEFFEIEDLATLALDCCFPYTWDREGCSIDPSGHFLAITNYREVQLAVEQQLNDMRAFYASRNAAPRFELPAKLRADIDEAHRLANLPVTTALESDEGTAVEWLSHLAQLTDLNFHVTANAMSELDLEEAVSVGPLEGIHQMPLGQVVDSLGDQLDGRVTILPGWLILHSDAESYEERAHLHFDVWDIVAPMGEHHYSVLEAAHLEELIHQLVDTESWENDPANSIRVTEDGVLAVSQSAEALDEVCELLQRLQKVAITTRGRIPRVPTAGR